MTTNWDWNMPIGQIPVSAVVMFAVGFFVVAPIVGAIAARLFDYVRDSVRRNQW